MNALTTNGIHVEPSGVDFLYYRLHHHNYPSLSDFAHSHRIVQKRSAVSHSILRNPTQLPPKLLEFIEDPNNGFLTLTSSILSVRKSSTGRSLRISIQIRDQEVIDTVVMRYSDGERDLASLSVASQVRINSRIEGCRNLTTAEILEQVIHAQKTLENEDSMMHDGENNRKQAATIFKVAFMGGGDPLLNYDNVVQACAHLKDSTRWNLRGGRITISTLGVTPRIYDLTRDLPDVILAVGLHAPNQKLREEHVEIAKQYPLEGLIKAIDHFIAAKGKRATDRSTNILELHARRRVMLEYVMSKYPLCFHVWLSRDTHERA